MNFAMGNAKEDLAEKVYLHVNVENIAALSLYRSLGFQPHTWIDDYYESEEKDGLFMVFNFSQPAKK
jgi:ribosomal protein S18 acetylase RimI-like enzyme